MKLGIEGSLTFSLSPILIRGAQQPFYPNIVSARNFRTFVANEKTETASNIIVCHFLRITVSLLHHEVLSNDTRTNPICEALECIMHQLGLEPGHSVSTKRDGFTVDIVT